MKSPIHHKKTLAPYKKQVSLDRSLMKKSVVFGALLGALFGAPIGGAFGALIMTVNGIVVGLGMGLALGILTGALTAALTVKTAGTTGGIGVGYFTGMIFGALFGLLLSVLIPGAWWARASSAGSPILSGLMVSRFETAMHISFLFSVLAAIIGVWVGGRNLVSNKLETVVYDTIDQYDLVEIVQVPAGYEGMIEVGDIGAVLEIDDNESFEIECIRPDGSYKWLATLHSRYIKLNRKIPDNM